MAGISGYFGASRAWLPAGKPWTLAVSLFAALAGASMMTASVNSHDHRQAMVVTRASLGPAHRGPSPISSWPLALAGAAPAAPNLARAVAPASEPPSASSGTAAPVAPAAAVKHAKAPAPAAPVPTTTPRASGSGQDCAIALAYLADHAKAGFAHYCRPGALGVGVAHVVAFTCMPGSHFSCPDGVAEIVIADPACAVSYENEASNSYWDFAKSSVVAAGTTQNGRTWDPYGSCP